MAKQINEESTRAVVCPSDERKTAEAFSTLRSNANVSYFVGVSANEIQAQSLLAGDRNLCGGTKPDDNYGFSPENGQGNDVPIQTNSKTAPVCRSLKMHAPVWTNGAGNVLLGDGSVSTVGTLRFRSEFQPTAGQTTNWPVGHTPSAPSIRVLFP